MRIYQIIKIALKKKTEQIRRINDLLMRQKAEELAKELGKNIFF